MKVRWIVLGVVAAVAFALPAQAQTFFDNFDSYAAVSTIAGQGGWESWDNSPAADTTVTNAQSYSSPRWGSSLGMTVWIGSFRGGPRSGRVEESPR